MMATTPNQHYCLRWNNHQVNMLAVFDELLQNEAFTDVAIGVDEGIFVKCHRVILAACSPYFQKLFIDIPTKNPIIILKDVKYNQIKAILEYMYRGEVSIAQDQLPTLLEIAECLKIKGLVEDKDSPPRSSTNRERKETEESSSPSPAISTSIANNMAHSESGTGQPSPPHSTSSPFYGYGTASAGHPHSDTRVGPPLWNYPFAAQNLAASVAQASSIQAHHASLLAAHFDNDLHNRKKLPTNFLMSRDTPILRTVLGQGHADSSQGLPLLHPDTQGHRTPSNGSANDNADGRRNSMDVPQARSPDDTYVAPNNGRKRSPRSHENHRPRAIKKADWKRYKQYSPEDITAAIEAVKCGMSALQSSRYYRVPSRTLYDKVKKLGISNSRSGGRRNNNNHRRASFPMNMGCNINGSIYANNNNDNAPEMDANPSAIIDAVLANAHDTSHTNETATETARSTPSPNSAASGSQEQEHQQHIKQQQPEDNEDQVEDLSVNRNSDRQVIVPPIIKEEKIDNTEKSKRK